VRFEERLVVTWDLEQSALPLRMPPMLLHPLVENAIKHGMRGLPLELNVSVRRSGGRLVFEVSNSGSLSPPVDALLPPTSGIGLRNVTARLAQLYPGTSAFELTERDGRVVAHLELPEVA
jgi:LytS/YehU family sensor histidine kinase